MRRLAAVTAAIVLMPVGAWMIHNRIGPAIAEPYWEQYLIALKRILPNSPRPTTPIQRRVGIAINAAVARENKLIDCLENVVYWQPNHASAHLALAEAHLRLFDDLQANSPNPMTLINIRDAALDSDFSSPQALRDWLARAWAIIGCIWTPPCDHTRQALSLCPLQGRGYIYLAKIGFLDGNKSLPKQACIAQALKSPAFRRRRGLRCRRRSLIGRRHAALAGAFQAGISLRPRISEGTNLQSRGQRPLRRHPGHDRFHHHSIPTRSGRPAITLCRLLKTGRSRAAGSPLSISGAAGRIRGAAIERIPGRSELWLEAQRLHTQLNNGPQALQCARRALECDRNNYHAHYQLASCLLDQGLFAEAETHLHWCLQRATGDKSVEIKLKRRSRAGSMPSGAPQPKKATSFKGDMPEYMLKRLNTQK